MPQGPHRRAAAGRGRGGVGSLSGRQPRATERRASPDGHRPESSRARPLLPAAWTWPGLPAARRPADGHPRGSAERRPAPPSGLGPQRSVVDAALQRVLDGRLPPVVPDTPPTRRTVIWPPPGVRDRRLRRRPGADSTARSRDALLHQQTAQPQLKDVDLRLLEMLAGILAELDVADDARPPRSRRCGDEPRRDLRAGSQPGPPADRRRADRRGRRASRRWPGSTARSRRRSGSPRPSRWGCASRSSSPRPARALAALDRPGHVGYLSLNLSAEAILSEEFTALVAATDPCRLVIEITEHAAVEDYEALDHGAAPTAGGRPAARGRRRRRRLRQPAAHPQAEPGLHQDRSLARPGHPPRPGPAGAGDARWCTSPARWTPSSSRRASSSRPSSTRSWASGCVTCRGTCCARRARTRPSAGFRRPSRHILPERGAIPA